MPCKATWEPPPFVLKKRDVKHDEDNRVAIHFIGGLVSFSRMSQYGNVPKGLQGVFLCILHTFASIGERSQEAGLLKNDEWDSVNLGWKPSTSLRLETVELDFLVIFFNQKENHNQDFIIEYHWILDNLTK